MAPTWVRVLSALGRFGLAGVWLYSGVTKALDPVGTHQAVLAYKLLDYDTSYVVAVVLPAVEIVLGVCLLIGLFVRPVAVVSGLLFIGFIAGIASAWARGLTIDCGCFGGGGVDSSVTARTYLTEIVRDIVFILLAAVVMKWPFRRLAVYP